MSSDPVGPGSSQRDRDASGRAHNARPRDGLGRPLGRSDGGGVERVPDDLLLAPLESLAEAQRLLDAGRPFHAHEVLEASWKAAEEVYAEYSARSPLFKRGYDSMAAFRQEQYTYAQIAEYAFDSYQVRQLRR